MKKYYWLKYIEFRIVHKNGRCYRETESMEVQILIDQTPLSWLLNFNDEGDIIRDEIGYNNVKEEVSYNAKLVDWKKISETDYNLFDKKKI